MDEKLEIILSQHIEQMTADEFASICNSIQGSSEEGELFKSFVTQAVPQAEQWLRDNAFSLADLPSVIAVYGQAA